ncbi:hypothetical protein H4Q32_024845 [Labeo rohita]|uniref:Alpha-macroglobulin-like TED domain-containing protein n=1 Tax=Labeo rohita TaxID=84645 RepID=A0ABQ8L4W9_LABRO|nr:hypothetical protein H4Q32_024845 [Labeo rohita]
MVILEKTEDMCSVAFSRTHRQQVLVPAGSSKVITYTIIPLKTGELPLQVTAVPRSFIEADAVRKNLRVVVEGIQRIKSRSFVLNPSEKGDSGRQVIKVEKMELKSVVPNSKPKAFINVRGYENQLNFRKNDDSYPPYAKEGTSTWITAYVVKVFSMAKSFISVNDKNLCGPLGGLQGSESTVSLTAFVLIALAEAQNAVTCREPGLNIQHKRNTHKHRTHWTDSDNRFFTLEATGYALLALIKDGHMKEAVEPFQWLNEQRDIGGGYGSTQVRTTQKIN